MKTTESLKLKYTNLKFKKILNKIVQLGLEY